MWESPAAGPRECRVGPSSSSMSKTTPIQRTRTSWVRGGRVILQRGEQRPRQGPSLRLKTSLRGKPGEAQRRDVGAECRTTGFDILDRLESDLKGTLEHDDLPGWGAATRCGLRHRLWTSNRWEPGRANRRGRRDARDALNGLTSPSEARSDGASDHNFKSAPARSNWSTTASVGGDHQLTKSCRSCRCEVGGQPWWSFSHPSRLGVSVLFMCCAFPVSASLRASGEIPPPFPLHCRRRRGAGGR